MEKQVQKRSYRKTRPETSNTMIYGKLPPQANELEEAVLGAILLEKDKLSDVLEILPTANCFYATPHQKIYSAVLRLSSAGEAIDLLTVAEELKKTGELEEIGGPFYLTQLTNSIVSSAHVLAHARIVMEKFIMRELIRISSDIIKNAYEQQTEVFELLDKAETNLFDISNNYLRNNYNSMSNIVQEAIESITKSRNQKSDITGVPSGFSKLDSITAGWQKTDLIILAARPSVGKTAFALSLGLNAALAPEPRGVAIFSLEMAAVQIVKRMISTVSQVSLEKISRGNLEEYEYQQIVDKASKLAEAPIFIDDQAGLNIFELRAKCRRLKSAHDIQLIIIDYLQLMHGPADQRGNREQEISKISRELKGLAKELDVPIIALSQLSRAVETRAGDKGKIPQLSDLRESGAIEQDADMVMFIYRPEYHGIDNDEHGESIKGETHINIAKHRNGRLDSVKLQARLEFQTFVEIEDDWHQGDGFSGPPGSSGDNFQTLPSKANDMSFGEQDFSNTTGFGNDAGFNDGNDGGFGLGNHFNAGFDDDDSPI